MHDETEIESWSAQGPVTELSDEHCWQLLDAESFGRLAIDHEGRPDLFPIDFHVDGRTIVFRTAEGNTKVRDLQANPYVALEADERTDATAKSVVLRGRADLVTDGDEIARLDRVPLPPWIPSRPYTYIRIVPASVRGRSFVHHLRVDRGA